MLRRSGVGRISASCASSMVLVRRCAQGFHPWGSPTIYVQPPGQEPARSHATGEASGRMSVRVGPDRPRPAMQQAYFALTQTLVEVSQPMPPAVNCMFVLFSLLTY